MQQSGTEGGRGKRALRRLHAWNGWTVLLLGLTGLLLYWPGLRGDLAGWSLRRVLLQVHIGLGFLSVALLISYLPFRKLHLRQIRGKRGQSFNLGAVLFLLTGWGLSGLGLTFLRGLPPVWGTGLLLVHDLLTWIGLPWAAYHSISRSRWLRRENQMKASAEESAYPMPQPWYTRREFVRTAVGAGLALAAGGLFYRWLSSLGITSGEANNVERYVSKDPNRMLPQPVPMPASLPAEGEGSRGHFRIYTVTEMPVFHSEDWSFAADGMIEQAQSWNWEQFLKLPRVTQVSDFHCITGWSVYGCMWEGIPLSALLDQVGVKDGATHVKLYSGDGVYTDALDLKQARMENVLLAVLLDGKPLPQQLGGPVRLVVPDMYAYKSVKWLQRIELIDKEHLGYWQVRGYEKDAWVKGKGRT